MFDVIPFGTAELLTKTLAAVATSYSAGVVPVAQAGAMGLNIVVANGVTPPTTVDVVAYVETAAAGVSGADNASWVSTGDSVAFTAAGTYSLVLGQPILDQVRLRFVVAAIDNSGVIATTYWLADNAAPVAN